LPCLLRVRGGCPGTAAGVLRIVALPSMRLHFSSVRGATAARDSLLKYLAWKVALLASSLASTCFTYHLPAGATAGAA